MNGSSVLCFGSFNRPDVAGDGFQQKIFKTLPHKNIYSQDSSHLTDIYISNLKGILNDLKGRVSFQEGLH